MFRALLIELALEAAYLIAKEGDLLLQRRNGIGGGRVVDRSAGLECQLRRERRQKRTETHDTILPRTETISRRQLWAIPRRQQASQGMVKEHLTLRWAHSVQRRGARWVERTASTLLVICVEGEEDWIGLSSVEDDGRVEASEEKRRTSQTGGRARLNGYRDE